MLWLDNQRENIERDITSYPNYRDWQARSSSFADMAAYSGRRFNLTSGEGEPAEVIATRVTSNFFDVLDVPLVNGRPFIAEEEIPGHDRVAILSHGLWQSRFGSARDVVGTTLRMNGEPWTVVGVTPPGFQYPDGAQLWVPLAPDSGAANARGALWLSVIGRLAPGATLAAAQTEMSGIAQQLAEEYTQNRSYGVRLEALHETVVGAARPALLVLFGAVAFVLLIACANVANLLLARAAARRREVSVRLAVGAGGLRLARQMLTESVVLSLAGGVVGLGLAAFGVRALVALVPPGIPRLDDLGVDRTVTVFTFLVALATGLLFGIAPALQAARASVAAVLRDEERGVSGRLGRLRPVLVMAEVSLALILLSGAGLMIRTFQALNDVDPGFDAANTLTVRVTPPATRYAEPAQVLEFYDRFTASLRELPGVQAVGAVSNVFLQRLPNMGPITVEGAPAAGPDDPVVSVVTDAATPEFFDAFGLDIIAGRRPDGTEHSESPTVVVVNETFVRQFLTEGDPIGRRFTFGNASNPDVNWATVIGVIADARRSGLTEPVRPEAYCPHRQCAIRGMTLLLKSSRDPSGLVPAVRDALRRIDPELPLAAVSTLEEQVARAESARRFLLQMLSLFAAVAAVLAAVGIYGVMAYLVSRRTREVGVRMAVGAARRDVMVLVLRDAAVQVIPGIAAGITGAILLARLMRSQLFGVSPSDPLTLSTVALFLLLIALLASWIPASRAATTDPLVALRSE
jgi:predicted permease